MRRYKPLSCVQLLSGKCVCAVSEQISGNKRLIAIQSKYREIIKDLAIHYSTIAIDTEQIDTTLQIFKEEKIRDIWYAYQNPGVEIMQNKQLMSINMWYIMIGMN